MPYEEAFLFANGLFGLPVLNQYDKNIKKVNGTEYTKYYNPMWNFFGDLIIRQVHIILINHH